MTVEVGSRERVHIGQVTAPEQGREQLGGTVGTQSLLSKSFIEWMSKGMSDEKLVNTTY